MAKAELEPKLEEKRHERELRAVGAFTNSKNKRDPPLPLLGALRTRSTITAGTSPLKSPLKKKTKGTSNKKRESVLSPSAILSPSSQPARKKNAARPTPRQLSATMDTMDESI
jgi:hypothetical protein